MLYNLFNQQSRTMIQNIANNFKAHPMSQKYTIQDYCYDLRAGVHAIEVSKNGQSLSLYLFYPDPAQTGKIGSIAIYGVQLENHLKNILASRTVFGLPIESAEIDRSGLSDYVDVYLNY